MQRRTFLKAAAASAGLAAAPSIALSAIPDGPAPWRDLVRHCMEMPKVAGYIEGAYLRVAGGKYWANTFATFGWSAEEACTELRAALDAYVADASRVFMRRLPVLREIIGDDDGDTRGGPDGIDRVVLFKWPYYVVSARLAVDRPEKWPDANPYGLNPEGQGVAGMPGYPELKILCGVSAEWEYRDFNTDSGEPKIIGPTPPKLVRTWHAPRPAGATVLH